MPTASPFLTSDGATTDDDEKRAGVLYKSKLTNAPCQNRTTHCSDYVKGMKLSTVEDLRKLQLAFKPLSIPAPKKAGVTGSSVNR